MPGKSVSGNPLIGKSAAIVMLSAFLPLALFITLDASALLYRTPVGSLKDNCVFWHEEAFYLFAMYRKEERPRDQDQWRHMWLATSGDGVHWQDVGPVIEDAPFGIYAMRVWKVGNRFVMNHGSFTGEQQDVLRLWASTDLIKWEYLGPDYDVRRPDGQRIDHMDVISVEEEGKTIYYGYAVGGVLRSEDGMKWTWLSELPLTGGVDIRVCQEPGGCQRIGDKFYLLVGGFYPGYFEYATSTYVSEHPTGPFRPDYPAFRLNGYSGRELVALWAAYCRKPGELLLSNYILDQTRPFWWHAPLKAAVVDGEGHIRMGYWKGNDALKGVELPCTAESMRLASADSNGTMSVAGGQITLTAPPLPQVRWITPGKPNIAATFLDTSFDFEKGCVVEGSLKVTALDGIVFPAAGFCLEQADGQATAVLFGTWAETQIGTLHLSDTPCFEAKDSIGFGCAAAAGVKPGEISRFRILIRKGIFEIYLNDFLVQTYASLGLTGRLGFIVQDGQVVYDFPKVWMMSLP
ncbi:MAG: hypothetical protein GXY07_07205 [Candidatus Hydrogenedentes bacterium]|nr:hypothetical protein [Candidatus Hydrogenedentota bacterium]